MKLFPVTLALVFGLAGCSTPTWTAAPSSNAPRKNVTIQVSDGNLRPATARILSGGNVAWTNVSASFAVVFLSTETAQALGCSSMRPIFAEVAGGYQSESITPDGEEVILPCKPADGTYPYEVRLFMQAMEGADNPDSVIHGTIVVGGSASTD